MVQGRAGRPRREGRHLQPPHHVAHGRRHRHLRLHGQHGAAHEGPGAPPRRLAGWPVARRRRDRRLAQRPPRPTRASSLGHGSRATLQGPLSRARRPGRQALNDPGRYNFMASKKTLEINPYHPIIAALAQRSADAPEEAAGREAALALFDTSLIAAGFDIDDQVVQALL